MRNMLTATMYTYNVLYKYAVSTTCTVETFKSCKNICIVYVGYLERIFL